MEKRINITELLKNCPEGMELDCTIWDNVTLGYVCKSNSLPICVRIPNNGTIFLSKYGQLHDDNYCKCVIFPKGKTTWEGFIPPGQFKDGDIIYFITENDNEYISILQNTTDFYVETYADFTIVTSECSLGTSFYVDKIKHQRLATEEEREKLFQAIKDNGYKWNAETKTIEKLPKFKVGDKIIHKESGLYCYLEEYAEGLKAYHTSIGLALTCKDLEQWELAPNKFDITTLKPFDKVLVRNFNTGIWFNQFYMLYDGNEEYPFTCTYNCWKQCVPYEGNEHLLGTTDDCNDFYNTWE